MNKNKLIGIALILGSLICMVLGWILPFMNIRAMAQMLFMQTEVFNETRSISKTIWELYEGGFLLPAFLLFLFGMIIPVIKSLSYLYFIIQPTKNKTLYNVIIALNKWAMADVFSLSILISFLVISSMSNSDVRFFASLESGFYFFTAYVILGGISSYFIPKPKSDN